MIIEEGAKLELDREQDSDRENRIAIVLEVVTNTAPDRFQEEMARMIARSEGDARAHGMQEGGPSAEGIGEV